MKDFTPVYIPVGVPTFHLESAKDLFERSVKALRSIDPDFTVPDDMLLSVDAMSEYISDLCPDLIVFQDLTFANAAYMTEVVSRFDCPVLLWTLREPVIDGTRLRLNSLTGAYSAANAMRLTGRTDFEYVFGSPEEDAVISKIKACVKAAEIMKAMQGLRLATVGEPPQGFDFGRAHVSKLREVFGAEIVSVSVSDMIERAKSYTDEESEPYMDRSRELTSGLDRTPEKNLKDHARLYKAYSEFVRENSIGVLASRCWPDYFTEYGTPVCAVLSMLNDDGTAAACEADVYGALSMWTGMKLSSSPVFFGDPVSLDEEENTLTFWHCGTAACTLARKDTGAVVGVHPNRKIGPAMDFGCEAFPEATIFRIGREPDGSYRFFILEGEALDKPKQFTGTSIVIKTTAPVREAVETSVLDGFEPHFVVMKGHHAETLKALAKMFGFKAFVY
ncbi:MAG: fucose isomerase [Mogibacterium sp.]|nr:fucose isomerase [Mogibacterium sp.]